jgi:predicted DCC family thiol-disulfide oxidoreductase YuxK
VPARIRLSVSDLDDMGGRVLVIFDGHCGLCNGSVRWFLVRDRKDRLRFVPSESPKVAEILRRHGANLAADPAGPDTILVVRDPGGPRERLLERSDGVMAMLEELPRPWPAVAKVLRWIPRGLRDFVYRLVAGWRYRIWGRLESCPLPTAEERGRFL